MQAAWDGYDVGKGVWVFDSGSTRHVTADRSQFTSYKSSRVKRRSWESVVSL